MAIGVIGDAGVRGFAKEPRLLNGFIMLLVFAEILGKQRILIWWHVRNRY
jgi:V-type H+-transporting ATPase proteolipid subunit